MPRINSVKSRQLTVAAPDQSKERVVARLGSLPVATYAATTPTDPFINNLGTGFAVLIYTIALQSDGKILVGGFFTELNGNTRNYLVRLNSDGTEDTAFYTNLGTGFNSWINDIAVQSDGKILVGGVFTQLNGNTRNRLVRLNSDGTEDTAFYANLGTGFGGGVSAITLQSDGKILVGGDFSTFNGNTRNRLVRLNSDGTEDTAFYTNLGTGFGSTVSEIAVQSDGKIVVGGTFTTLNGTTRNRLVRLNSDGTVDTAFYTNLGTGFDNGIRAITIQSDGKILVGGFFTTLNGTTRSRLVRLNSDGTVDTAFYTNLGTSFNNTVLDIAVQSDGKILVGGSLNTFNSNTRNRLVRLNTDGTEDTLFYTNLGTGFGGDVYAIALQSDEKIVVGGGFSSFNGNSRGRLVRLNSDGTESSINNIDEGSALTFTVTTANVRNGTVLRWRIIDRPEDFAVITGLVTINSNTGTFTVTPLADLLTEGPETFRVEISKLSGTVLATISAVTINDTSAATLTLTPSALSIDEGDTVTINVTVDTQNLVDGTVLYWTASSALDVVASSGSFEINSDTGSFTVTASQDFLTEGTETFTVSIRSISINGSIMATSDPITVNDTSVETYAITPAAASVNEGAALVFNVVTQGVPNSATLYWTATNSGDFSIASGSFIINNNAGSFSVIPALDATTEGSETFTVSVRTGSISGSVVATSSSVTINDISLDPTYEVTPFTLTAIPEGSGSLRIDVATTDVFDDTTLYWTIDSNAGDFEEASGSFTITDNAGFFGVTPTADRTTEGTETYTVSIRTGSISGPIVATTDTLSISDVSLTPAFTSASTSVIEGGSASFTANNLGPAGTYVWEVVNGTTTNARFTQVTGTFNTTTLNGSGSFTVPTAVNTVVGDTATFQVRILYAGSVILTSDNITLNDASIQVQMVTGPGGTVVTEVSEQSGRNIRFTTAANTPTYYYEWEVEPITASYDNQFYYSGDFSNGKGGVNLNSNDIDETQFLGVRGGDGIEIVGGVFETFRIIIKYNGQTYGRSEVFSINSDFQ